jgi:predicted nucleic acid-binding Zn ribbon protein
MIGDRTKCDWCGKSVEKNPFGKEFCSKRCRTEYEESTGEDTLKNNRKRFGLIILVLVILYFMMKG